MPLNLKKGKNKDQLNGDHLVQKTSFNSCLCMPEFFHRTRVKINNYNRFYK